MVCLDNFAAPNGPAVAVAIVYGSEMNNYEYYIALEINNSILLTIMVLYKYKKNKLSIWLRIWLIKCWNEMNFIPDW